MIISVTSLKGGVGKSTLSQNLAVCFKHMGYDVAVIDTDTNESSLQWADIRARNEEAEGIPTIACSRPDALRENVKQLNTKYEIIIIDGKPSLERIASTIIVVADLVLIPIYPSALDMWATEKFLETYEQAKDLKGGKLPAYFILNNFNAQHKFSQESKEALEDYDLGILSTTIKSRVAYKEAVVDGLGVYEYNNPKAKEEMIQLTNEVLQILQPTE